MSDSTALLVGAAIVVLILIFVGFRFGWSALGWIILSSIVAFVGSALVVRFAGKGAK